MKKDLLFFIALVFFITIFVLVFTNSEARIKRGLGYIPTIKLYIIQKI